jgi:MbtH protein
MSTITDDEDKTVYKVVINHEEQYSIWPVLRQNPLGWRDVGKEGPKQECLSYIEEVWTDMRPLSLRQRMAAEANRTGGATGVAEISSQE